MSMTDGERAVYDAAKLTYRSPEWIVLPQVSIGTGYYNYGGDRVIDLLILNAYPSKRFRVLAVEIKHSRSDWNADLCDPSKQTLAHLYSDDFYWCVPEELAKNPPINFQWRHDGLMIVRDGKLVIHRKPISKREKIPYSHGFVMALLRRAERTLG